MLTAAVLLLLTAGCTKKNLDNDLPYITFGVAGVDASTKADTKGLITGFTSATLPNVYVYGVQNNTEQIFNGDQITKENDSNNWNTGTRYYWSSGSSYSFYGYTSSPASSPTCLLKISNSGMTIDVSQPSTYSENDMVDYMLSHAYKVADGSNYHVVMLYMQHAMAWVEIVVKKQMDDHQITLNSIELRNIFRSATMQCEYQAIANKGESNVWLTTLSGNNNQTYSKEYPDFNPSGNFLGKMSILAVPQQLYSETVLSVNYTVDEDGTSDTGGDKTYTDDFQLFNYVPFVWESGHKITYTLTINTGVELKAEISDWKEAGYTEGIILPPASPGTGEEGENDNVA